MVQKWTHISVYWVSACMEDFPCLMVCTVHMNSLHSHTFFGCTRATLTLIATQMPNVSFVFNSNLNLETNAPD